MDKPIRDYIAITTELIVFAIVLSLIVYVANIGQNLLSIGQDRKAFNQELGVQRSLYQFNGRPMTGDDVVVSVKRYTKLYDMRIEKGIVGSGNYYVLDDKASEALWSEDTIRTNLGSDIQKLYKSSIIRNANGEITAIQFNRNDEP
jgi:hypothetical protein